MSNKEGWFSATGNEQCGVPWLWFCFRFPSRDLTFLHPVVLTQSTEAWSRSMVWTPGKAPNTECRSQVLRLLMRVSSFDNVCSSKSHRWYPRKIMPRAYNMHTYRISGWHTFQLWSVRSLTWYGPHSLSPWCSAMLSQQKPALAMPQQWFSHSEKEMPNGCRRKGLMQITIPHGIVIVWTCEISWTNLNYIAYVLCFGWIVGHDGNFSDCLWYHLWRSHKGNKHPLAVHTHYTRCFLKMQPSRRVAGGCREQPVRNCLCRAARVGRTHGIHGVPAFLTAMVHANLRGVRWAYKILQVHCHLKLFAKCNAPKAPQLCAVWNLMQCFKHASTIANPEGWSLRPCHVRGSTCPVVNRPGIQAPTHRLWNQGIWCATLRAVGRRLDSNGLSSRPTEYVWCIASTSRSPLQGLRLAIWVCVGCGPWKVWHSVWAEACSVWRSLEIHRFLQLFYILFILCHLFDLYII